MTPTIKITLTVHQLLAVNTIWQKIPKGGIATEESRVLVSISNHLAEKFIKKQLTLQFNGKPKTSLTLDYFKAYFLEKIIRTVLENFHHSFNEYELRQLVNIAGDLNQKMA